MSTLVAQTISNGTVSTSSANVIQGSAKAWVQWAGSSGSINGSFNVSSVTRASVGQYTITFTTALPNANYSAVSGGCVNTAASAFLDPIIFGIATSPYYQVPTTSSCTIRYALSTTGAGDDPVYGNIAIFSS